MIWRKEKFLPYRDSNSDPSVVQPVLSRYTLLRLTSKTRKPPIKMAVAGPSGWLIIASPAHRRILVLHDVLLTERERIKKVMM
jgi:hypothetical protein